MLFTWERKGSQVLKGQRGFLGRSLAGFAKVLGGALMAVAAFQYAGWLFLVFGFELLVSRVR